MLGLTTLTEVRVEKAVVPDEQTRPCERSAPGMPDADDPKLTLRDVTSFLPVLAGRLESCANQVDAFAKTVNAATP